MNFSFHFFESLFFKYNIFLFASNIMYYVVTHLVSSTFSCWIWKINNFSMGFNSRVCIWNDIHAINSQIPFPWRWTLKQQPQLLFNAISFQRQTGLLYRYRWRLPVWNVKNRRYLASCTLQFGSNLTKIIFQSKHFNYFIVVGGWRHVFEAIHIIVYPYATHLI